MYHFDDFPEALPVPRNLCLRFGVCAQGSVLGYRKLPTSEQCRQIPKVVARKAQLRANLVPIFRPPHNEVLVPKTPKNVSDVKDYDLPPSPRLSSSVAGRASLVADQ